MSPGAYFVPSAARDLLQAWLEPCLEQVPPLRSG